MRHRKHGIVQDVGGKLQCHKCRRRDCQHVDVVKYAVDNKDTEDIPSVVVVLQIAADLSENNMGSEGNNKYKSFMPIRVFFKLFPEGGKIKIFVPFHDFEHASEEVK